MRPCLLLGASSGGRGPGSGQPADSCTTRRGGSRAGAGNPTPWDGAGPSSAVRRREHWTRDLADGDSGVILEPRLGYSLLTEDNQLSPTGTLWSARSPLPVPLVELKSSSGGNHYTHSFIWDRRNAIQSTEIWVTIQIVREQNSEAFTAEIGWLGALLTENF